LGKEPQVLWRAYTEELLHAAQTLGISRIYTVGGVQDTVTHSAPAVVTVVGSNAEVVGEALGMGSGMRPGKYSGPISIHSRLLAACGKAGIPAVGLWGHVPAYLHKCPRLVAKLITLLARSSGADCSIEPLLARSVELDRRISEAVARDPELKQFVETIEGKKQPRPVSHKDKVIRLDECRKKDTPRTTE
jgi:proteasome assembly chaperone (PAC2) family protein